MRLTNPFVLVRYALAGWLPGGRRQCVACGNRVWRFMPYRGSAQLARTLPRTLETVGSDAEHFECPRCGAHDRTRHLLLYLQATRLLDGLSGKRVLHFAPERHLAAVIKARKPSAYVKADLFPASAEVEKVNISEMPFEDQSFDLLIANHVLEHVADDIKALSEIQRVLKLGGHAILQTPFSPRLTRTWEDEGINTDGARLIAFGQEDHVRLYGRDIFSRFASTGLQPMVSTHNLLLPGIDPKRLGVNPSEPFFLFRRIT